MSAIEPSLDQVAEVIGFTATLRVAAWFAITDDLAIPEYAASGDVLAQLLGLDLARRLSDAWPDQRIHIPARLEAYEDALLQRQVQRMLGVGFTPPAIARWLGLTDQRVEGLTNDLRASDLLLTFPASGRSAAQAGD